MSTRIITGEKPTVDKKTYTFLLSNWATSDRTIADLEARVRESQRIPAEATWRTYSAGGVIGSTPETQQRQIVWTWYEVTL